MGERIAYHSGMRYIITNPFLEGDRVVCVDGMHYNNIDYSGKEGTVISDSVSMGPQVLLVQFDDKDLPWSGQKMLYTHAVRKMN